MQKENKETRGYYTKQFKDYAIGLHNPRLILLIWILIKIPSTS